MDSLKYNETSITTPFRTDSKKLRHEVAIVIRRQFTVVLGTVLKCCTESFITQCIEV